MEEDWYFNAGGVQTGPMEWLALRQLAAAGQLGPADLVWTPKHPDWIPASTVQGLLTGSAPEDAAPTPALPISAGFASSDNYSAATQNANVLQYASPIPATRPNPATFIYAGFWLRFMAYLVDGVILAAITIPILIAFAMVMVNSSNQNTSNAMTTISTDPMINLVLKLFIGSIAWLYFAYQESGTAQATLGKRFMGLVVTDMQGERISFGRASGRHFGKLLSGIILGYGYKMAGTTPRKQALHDMMAGCLVILKPD